MGVARKSIQSWQAYTLFLCCCAAAILVHHSYRLEQADWKALLLFSVLIGVFSRMSLVTWATQQFNLSSAVQLMALLIGGLPLAVWAATIAAVAEDLVQGWDPWRAVYNTSQRAITLFVVGQFFLLAGGRTGLAFDHPFQALAASLVAVAVNTALIAGLFALLRRESLWRVLVTINRENLHHTYAMGQIMGVVATFLWLRGGPQWALLLFAMLLLLHHLLQRYFELLQDATARKSQLEAVLDATHSAIAMVDNNGMLQVVNRRYADMLGSDRAAVGRQAGAGLAQNSVYAQIEEYRRQLVADAGEAGRVHTITVDLPAHGRTFLDWYHGPVRDGRGRISGRLDVFTDVTRQKEAEESLRAMHMALLKALTAAIEVRDPYTQGHSARVSEYAGLLARRMNLDERQVEIIAYAGLLHDIGKIGIDDRVLRKQGPLSAAERAAMMEHPVIGAQILRRAGVFAELEPGVRHHHEWLNGGGYPDGLAGEQIPIAARILSVADAFDAMTSDRPYRPALSEQEALQRLVASTDLQFDAQVVAELTAAVAAAEIRSHDPARPRGDAPLYRPTGVVYLKDAVPHLVFAATHDPLTGVYNHTYLVERLGEELYRASRYKRTCAVVIVGLGLKRLAAPAPESRDDVVLKEYAAHLQRQVRQCDLVARFAYDQFAIVMPETNKGAATAVVQRLCKAAAREVRIGDVPVTLPGTTYGTATFPDDGQRAEELLAKAEECCYGGLNGAAARQEELGG